MVTALGVDLRKNNGLISCEVSVAKSQHYLARMHLFHYLNSGMKVEQHQPQADLYLWLRLEAHTFITEMIPVNIHAFVIYSGNTMLKMKKHPFKTNQIRCR